MTVTLIDFEIEVLNRFVPTQTLGDMHALKAAMHSYIREHKDEIIKAGRNSEAEFDTFTNRTVDNIASFLLHNVFFHDRDGQVFILTEKGRHLREQGSLQKYLAWEEERNIVLINEMHLIEKTGYLKREQPTKAELREHPVSEERKSYLVYYVLIIVALAAFYFIGKYHKFN